MTKSQALLVALVKKKRMLELRVRYLNNKITVEAPYLNHDEQPEFKKIRPWLYRQIRHLFETDELKKESQQTITLFCYQGGGILMTKPLWYYFEPEEGDPFFIPKEY